jgi:hypothetical protein
MADLMNRKEGAEAQRRFEKAGNANVVQQAGEGLDAASHTAPVPGDRLTAAEARAETGRRPDEGDPETRRDAGRVTDAEAKADEREALRRQGEKETDSDLGTGNRTEGSLALEDPVITSNPD